MDEPVYRLKSQEDAREILELLEAQDDFFVIHIRRFTFGPEFTGLFPEDACAECETEFRAGAPVYMWGEPASRTLREAKTSRFAALRFFCCEEHAETFTARWVQEIGFQEHAIAFHE